VARSPVDLIPGMTITVAVRPERIAIFADSVASSPANALRGELLDVSYRGGMSRYRVRLTFGAILEIARANAGDVPEPKVGQKVSLSIAPDACIFLEK
jgi:putrescine transport system ATP-binding protein